MARAYVSYTLDQSGAAITFFADQVAAVQPAGDGVTTITTAGQQFNVDEDYDTVISDVAKA
jgi:hypothetical protein